MATVQRDDLTWTTVRIENTYQDTGDITLLQGDNCEKRYRLWRLNSIRDVDDDDPRIRDSYMKVTFTFNPEGSSNKKILCHDINTLYVPIIF